MNGDYCPEVEHAPRTDEGRAILDVIDRPGVWRRAGLSGIIAGLDLAGALQSLPDGKLDRDFARRLLITAEAHFVSAWMETNKPIDK